MRESLIPASIRQSILSATEPDPEQRDQSMSVFRSDLISLVDPLSADSGDGEKSSRFGAARGSNRVRVPVTDEFLSRWCVRSFQVGLLAVAGIAGYAIHNFLFRKNELWIEPFLVLLNIVGSIGLFSGIVMFIWWSGRCWQRLPTIFQRMTSRKSRIQLSIPVVNLIGSFFVLPKLADAYDGAADEHLQPPMPKSAYWFGMALCILNLVPIVNVLVAPILVSKFIRRIDAIHSELSSTQAVND